MRRHSNIMALAMVAAAVGAVDPGPPPVPGKAPPRPLPPTPRPLIPPPPIDRSRLELDLTHAEDRLQRARTPGARRKAQRTVDALRRMLAEA